MKTDAHVVDLKSFVSEHVTPYEGDDSFLVGPTEKTKKLWDICKQALLEEHQRGWCRAIDPVTISTITSHAPWYIDKDLEVVVWLQTDELLKRSIKPFGGIRIV